PPRRKPRRRPLRHRARAKDVVHIDVAPAKAHRRRLRPRDVSTPGAYHRFAVMPGLGPGIPELTIRMLTRRRRVRGDLLFLRDLRVSACETHGCQAQGLA